MDRSGKEQVVQQTHERLKDAQLVVRVGFTGLKVEQMNSLRREMERIDGTSLVVLKNTLAKIAAKDTPTESLFESLEGPNGFLISRDELVGPAKVLVNFAKANDKLVIRDGAVGGKVVTDAQIKALADMPSREELLARLAWVLNAPVQSFVGVLAAIPRSLLNVLNAVKAEKEKKWPPRRRRATSTTRRLPGFLKNDLGERNHGRDQRERG
ncbi:MAG: 50S ribosomal protein L10 [Deltaproteobacteria bacterium]|nr:50S ribosomal protein L10 [Deltaproteobacteria bacterium]